MAMIRIKKTGEVYNSTPHQPKGFEPESRIEQIISKYPASIHDWLRQALLPAIDGYFVVTEGWAKLFSAKDVELI
jgi:hypothetical protein